MRSRRGGGGGLRWLLIDEFVFVSWRFVVSLPGNGNGAGDKRSAVFTFFCETEEKNNRYCLRICANREKFFLYRASFLMKHFQTRGPQILFGAALENIS